ncbi:hypothetical protein DIPPA_00248 [Diplonema papillatum]|nr:hypothetical protein DIPPA_00248 [Diplonema papillatum]
MFMHFSKKLSPRPKKPPSDTLTAFYVRWTVYFMLSFIVFYACSEGHIRREFGLLALCVVVRGIREVVNSLLPEVKGFQRKGRFMQFVDEK